MLHELQCETFEYFLKEADPDKTKEGSPSSIAATGFAFAIYPVVVERGFLTRAQAIRRTLAALRFFSKSSQSEAPDASGYRGF